MEYMYGYLFISFKLKICNKFIETVYSKYFILVPSLKADIIYIKYNVKTFMFYIILIMIIFWIILYDIK